MIYTDKNLMKLGLLAVHSYGKQGKFEDWDLQRKEAYYRDVSVMLEAGQIAENLDGHSSSSIAAVASELLHHPENFLE